MVANACGGLPTPRLGAVARASMDWTAQASGRTPDVDDPAPFPPELRREPALRAAILGAAR